jgi:hypothetical protein
LSRTGSGPGNLFQGPVQIPIIVERRQDPTDIRSFRVYLTATGSLLEGPVARCWAQTEEKALAGLSAGARYFGSR